MKLNIYEFMFKLFAIVFDKCKGTRGGKNIYIDCIFFKKKIKKINKIDLN